MVRWPTHPFLVSRGLFNMKSHRGYYSVACFLLCPSQSIAFVSRQTAASISKPFHHQSSSFPIHPSLSTLKPQRQPSSRCFSSSTKSDIDLVSETSHLPRLYVDSPSLLERNLITLSPFQSNYLNVMRVTNAKRWGQWAGHVRIFNGKDGEWLAKVVMNEATSSETPKKRRRKGNSSVGATILECVQQTIPQPSKDKTWEVHLHMGKLKKQRRKWVLEKTTELGITSINIVDMEYSEQKEPWEHEKHQAQVIEAAEQCERLTVPSLVETPTSWTHLMERILESSNDGNQHYWLVCRERSINETLPILSALEQITDNSSKTCLHILVGPEGGWSPTELADLAGAKANENTNLHFVSLGSLVLRAETATISAVTAAMLTMDQRQR